MKIFLFFVFYTFQVISATEIVPEKVEIESINKYLHNMKFTFRRRSRNSPYYITYDFLASTGYGNNVTLKWNLNEYLSGNYIMLPIMFEYRLCDFLYKDQYLGKMFATQLRGNWSCPFPPGRSPFRNLVAHVENMPMIPFTYSSLIVRTRVDIGVFMGPHSEEIAKLKIYMIVKQTMKPNKNSHRVFN